MNRINTYEHSNQVKNWILNKRIAFLTLGCKVNSYETEAMQQLFQSAGATLVAFEETADVYVVNTCTVTNIADRKSRQMLHRAKHHNPSAIVVAVGCYVQAAKEELLSDEGIDLIVGNNQKGEIVSIVNSYFANGSQPVLTDIAEEEEYEALSLTTISEKTRAYIKIQDGCNQFCSYCIIPYARGRIRSRELSSIVEEVRILVEKGYQEIVLTGIHLSSYGLEHYSLEEQKALKTKDGHSPLLQLINALNQVKGLKRIRLGSLEPRIITEHFVKNLAMQDKVCPHFHLSLQSGCDETLKRMNRKYTVKEYEQGCRLLRQFFEQPSITTDVIVGFPGETKEEFIITKEFLEKISFSAMHIFKYSKRKGTIAEKMESQISGEIKNERSNALIKLEEQMRHKYQALFVGKTEEVLFEEFLEIDGETYLTGHTTRYLKIICKSKLDLSNQLVKIKVCKEFDKMMMLGEVFNADSEK